MGALAKVGPWGKPTRLTGGGSEAVAGASATGGVGAEMATGGGDAERSGGRGGELGCRTGARNDAGGGGSDGRTAAIPPELARRMNGSLIGKSRSSNGAGPTS